MALFKINDSEVTRLTTHELNLERDLQTLFESNLEEILNIFFLAHEYSTSFGGRIDTLGIDKDGAPCIIEYKKSQNDSVINQGLSYLRWLLDHKADFDALCQKKNIEISVDWESPRVICIAESYNKFDIDTADILPINIELLRYRIYEGNLLYLEAESYQKVKISTSAIIRKSKQDIQKVEKLQRTYTIEEHLKGIDKKVIELFELLREKILSIDESIQEVPKSKYIAYKTSTNFTDIHLQQSGVKIYLNIKSGELKDPDNQARDLTKPTKIGHWGNGDYLVKLEKKEDLEKVFELIKQSYELNK